MWRGIHRGAAAVVVVFFAVFLLGVIGDPGLGALAALQDADEEAFDFAAANLGLSGFENLLDVVIFGFGDQGLM